MRQQQSGRVRAVVVGEKAYHEGGRIFMSPYISRVGLLF